MINNRQHVDEKVSRRAGRFLTTALLVASLWLPNIGCSMMPRPISNLPSKIGIGSKQAELRSKVESDKFPTAKEAGI